MLRGWKRIVAGIVPVLLAASAQAGEPADPDVSLGVAVALEQLDEYRAGEGRLQLNRQDVNASLEENNAINTISGSNSITGDAFANASGLPVAVQNSGNNVVIQNAFILNLNVK